MDFKCAIAAPHTLATEAGEKAVRDGGNAIDAALAAAAALTVVYPHMCSIGGDLFALVGLPGGEVVAVDGSGAAAAGVDAEALAGRYGEMPTGGIDTVTVPGVLSGWDEVASLGSVRGSAGYVEAAAAFAADGVPVAPSLAEAILQDRASISTDEGMRAIFARDGKQLGVGDPLIQPELAESLRQIAAEGAGAFYRGSLGSRFLEGLNRLGSPLSREDLAEHRATRSGPLSGQFGGLEVMTSPPGSQGFVLLEMLQAIEVSGRDDLLGDGAGLLAWIARLASADRDRHLADPGFADVPLAELLSPEYAAELVSRAESAPGQERSLPPQPPRPTGDTVAVVAADSDGRAVSLIQSVFHAFGSGILEPATGIISHNRGACFSLDPSSPNRIAPGKRPAHTLMPVLVRDEGGRLSAHGTMGGRAQPQIHTQLLLRRLAGSDPGRAVAAPRFVVGGLDAGSELDLIYAEDDLDPGAAAALERSGLEMRAGGVLDEIVGHTALAVSTDTGLRAASDPRADGSAGTVERGG
ncbi:MAG: gamma-glutamyltransferase [Solirubrobacterales bacterium]|nr:gamma-glutamyltransferase [Solirubrobacterales bacterium]